MEPCHKFLIALKLFHFDTSTNFRLLSCIEYDNKILYRGKNGLIRCLLNREQLDEKNETEESVPEKFFCSHLLRTKFLKNAEESDQYRL